MNKLLRLIATPIILATLTTCNSQKLLAPSLSNEPPYVGIQKEYDSNGNGLIEYNEFYNYAVDTSSAKTLFARAIFNNYDFNKDGHWDDYELSIVWRDKIEKGY